MGSLGDGRIVFRLIPRFGHIMRLMTNRHRLSAHRNIQGGEGGVGDIPDDVEIRKKRRMCPESYIDQERGEGRVKYRSPLT